MKKDDLTDVTYDSTLDNLDDLKPIDDVKEEVKDDLKPIDLAMKDVNTAATATDDFKADEEILNDMTPRDVSLDDVKLDDVSDDLKAAYDKTLHSANDTGDIDFIKDVEADGAFKDENQVQAIADTIPDKEVKPLTDLVDEEKPNLHIAKEHQTGPDNFAYSYDWDEGSFKDFEQIYLYDFNQQIAKTEKSNKFSLIISIALVMFCIFMATQVFLGVRPGPITIYLIGMIVGAFSFTFVKSYPEKARAKAIDNLKAYLYTNDFHLRVDGDKMYVGSDELDLHNYENAIVYKDILLLTSTKLNNFIMINLKGNADAEKLLTFIKDKSYIETHVETEPFSMNKYGIVAKK